MTRAGLAAIAAFFLISPTVCSAVDVTSPKVETHKIADGVHVIYGGNGLGASVGVVETREGLVLIDAMRQKTASQLDAALKQISDKPVSHVFNTHRHEDHTDGNIVFTQKGAVLIRQANAPDGGEAKQVRFEERIDLNIGDVQFVALAARSHTPDDALVYLPGRNVIFLGDTFTTNWHPTFYSGGEAGQYAVIDRVLELADEHTVIVPGHGRVTDWDGVVFYKAAFTDWMARMRELTTSGASADQMEADTALKAIARRFLQDGSKEEIRPAGYRRFIERTISTELMPVDESVLAQLADYVGDYRYEDGMALRIDAVEGGLRIVEGGHLSGVAIPLSRGRFHFPGRLEGEGHLTFQFDDEGGVIGATYVGEDRSWPATRVSD